MSQAIRNSLQDLLSIRAANDLDGHEASAFDLIHR